MTIEEAAKRLGCGEQVVRWGMMHGTLPIGICIPAKGRTQYIVHPEWLEKYIAGNPVEIPERFMVWEERK